jgi:methylenetetrahydrofolate dehydrogenase (NADP+)/methenyltetrahydrofolate cyclohydrolase
MIISGRQIADRILEDVKARTVGRNLCIVAVIVGSNLNLEKFVRLKEDVASLVGINFKLVRLSKTLSQEEIEKAIINLDSDPSVHGIFVELPLPAHLDKTKILNLISAKKDVDLLSDKAKKKFENGDFNILPPTVFAIDQILKEFNIEPDGKSVAIFGMGELVGKPASVWFRNKGSDVQEIDEFTENTDEYSKEADIIISGVGKPDLITKEMIKEGAIVFDFGYGIKDDRIKGDVCDDTRERASLLTPVPGGVGPLVVAAIFHNLILLNR